jgi:hypothetical protein
MKAPKLDTNEIEKFLRQEEMLIASHGRYIMKANIMHGCIKIYVDNCLAEEFYTIPEAVEWWNMEVS